MRSREEIEKTIRDAVSAGSMSDLTLAEILLDIRDLLQAATKLPQPVYSLRDDRNQKCDYCNKVDARIYPEDDEHCTCGNSGTYDAPPEKDELFDDVKKYVIGYGKGNTFSVHTIRAYFNISYARATALIDQLESAGIINKKEGNKPRRVL